jgi:hypothetical protein
LCRIESKEARVNVLQYFNLNTKPKTDKDRRIFFVRRSSSAIEGAQPPQMPWWEQLIMYAGLVLGVVASSAVLNGGTSKFAVNWHQVLWACLIGLILMPTVFRKLTVTPDSPFIVRLGFFVQNGVFWQTVLEGVRKAI